MNDLLMNLGQNPGTRRMIKSLGLPIPLPQQLKRASGPYQERPLADRAVVVSLGPDAELIEPLAHMLARAGADPQLIMPAGQALPQPFIEAGEAHGRPPQRFAHSHDNGTSHGQRSKDKNGKRKGGKGKRKDKRGKVEAVVLDASGLTHPRQLRVLYDALHPLVGALKRCSRVVVLGRPVSAAGSAAEAAAQRALDGFVRSLAKEVGRKGSTAQLLVVTPGAEARLEGVLRFVLSERSAFVSGQPIVIDAQAKLPADATTTWTKPLEGKVALVTGAARGIGRATARLLAAEGAKVVCLDRPQDDGPLSQVARSVGGEVLACDVNTEGAAQQICDALAAMGGVDIVIHNAGVTRDKTLARMKEALWDQALGINLSAVVDITDALLQGPLRDGGRIICLSSVAGIAGNMGQTNYGASKAGIIGLVESLAPRVAERSITVNAVAPGFIETRLTAAIPTMVREVGRRLSALGQGGKPVDVAEAITFLATPGASGLSGRVLRVCGGAFIGA